MSANVHVQPAGAQASDGSRGTSRVTANTRVSTSGGAISLLGDSVLLGGPTVTGSWAAGSMRVTVLGTPVINGDSMGVCANPAVADPTDASRPDR